jgi:hypothetical protein
MNIIENCDDCGVCCMEQCSPPLYAWILARLEGWEPGGVGFFTRDSPEDLARVRALPEELKQGLRDYLAILRVGGEHPNEEICLWCDEEKRSCKHHELRPQICRDFDTGCEDCLHWRESYSINKGELNETSTSM